jgi:hypothetical protein
MATRKINDGKIGASAAPLDMDLPDDGTPVTFSQTFAKRVGVRVEDDRVAVAEDFEDSEWEVRRQTPDGWEFVEKIEGMPLDNELREDYGAGKYELTPVDPRTGKLIKQLRKVRLISSTISPAGMGAAMPFDQGYPNMQQVFGQAPAGGDEMPAWMRWQMQQGVEERQEQRRRAEEALTRQRDFEEKLALREFERQEREERDRKRKEVRDADESSRRDERFSQILSAGVGLVQIVLTNRAQQPQGKDVNDVLLRELMEDRRSRTPQANGMRDSLDLLLVLDKLAQTRASAMGRHDDDDDEKLLTTMLPAMLNRGGSAGAASPEMMDQMIERAFSDPDTIQKIAARNPQATASAFMRAVKENPALEQAVYAEIEGSSGSDSGSDSDD